MNDEKENLTEQQPTQIEESFKLVRRREESFEKVVKELTVKLNDSRREAGKLFCQLSVERDAATERASAEKLAQQTKEEEALEIAAEGHCFIRMMKKCTKKWIRTVQERKLKRTVEEQKLIVQETNAAWSEARTLRDENLKLQRRLEAKKSQMEVMDHFRTKTEDQLKCKVLEKDFEIGSLVVRLQKGLDQLQLTEKESALVKEESVKVKEDSMLAKEESAAQVTSLKKALQGTIERGMLAELEAVSKQQELQKLAEEVPISLGVLQTCCGNLQKAMVTIQAASSNGYSLLGDEQVADIHLVKRMLAKSLQLLEERPDVKGANVVKDIVRLHELKVKSVQKFIQNVAAKREFQRKLDDFIRRRKERLMRRVVDAFKQNVRMRKLERKADEFRNKQLLKHSMSKMSKVAKEADSERERVHLASRSLIRMIDLQSNGVKLSRIPANTALQLSSEAPGAYTEHSAKMISFARWRTYARNARKERLKKLKELCGALVEANKVENLPLKPCFYKMRNPGEIDNKDCEDFKDYMERFLTRRLIMADCHRENNFTYFHSRFQYQFPALEERHPITTLAVAPTPELYRIPRIQTPIIFGQFEATDFEADEVGTPMSFSPRLSALTDDESSRLDDGVDTPRWETDDLASSMDMRASIASSLGAKLQTAGDSSSPDSKESSGKSDFSFSKVHFYDTFR